MSSCHAVGSLSWAGVIPLCFLAAGCLAPAPVTWDQDADGTTRLVDCDDQDPARSPAFSELCDGFDTDCVNTQEEERQGADRDCTAFFQQVSPCAMDGEASFDLWRVEGPTTVFVDTVDEETSFDPVLARFESADGLDDPSGLADDEVPCTFAPPNGYRCPQAELGPGSWIVGVVAFVRQDGACSDPLLGRYQIDFGGVWAELLAEDQPWDSSWLPSSSNESL